MLNSLSKKTEKDPSKMDKAFERSGKGYEVIKILFKYANK